MKKLLEIKSIVHKMRNGGIYDEKMVKVRRDKSNKNSSTNSTCKHWNVSDDKRS